MTSTPRADADSIREQLVAWRRHFHAHPELGGHEEQTAVYLAAQLRQMGYEPVERVGDTFGLTATLQVGDTTAVALRADMDALPVVEESEVEYASRNPGVMHACGHDAHMAMLLGAAQLLKTRKDELKRSVKLIFQPAEETPPGGAADLIAAGVLEGVARIYGLHIWSEMPLGTLGTREGPFMSSVSDLRITVVGRGGHAAMPQQCIDPIVVAAEIVTALQTAVSRSIAMADSAVVTITQIHGGTAVNVIPPEVELVGTVRTLSDAVRATIDSRIVELATGIAQAYGARAEVELVRGYATLVNDRQAVADGLRTARSVGFTDDHLLTLPAQGGGEDFAHYCQEVPGAFFFLGARNEERNCAFTHHHPRFNIDEDALPLGAALLAQFALDAGEHEQHQSAGKTRRKT